MKTTPKTPKRTPKTIVESARKKAAEVSAWADLANYLFDPETGLVARAYPDIEDRRRFAKTEEYRAIWRLIEDAQDRTGLIEGAIPKKSGRFVVRLPQSLHRALEMEAAREGVSLNQLVVAKLSTTLAESLSKATAIPAV